MKVRNISAISSVTSCYSRRVCTLAISVARSEIDSGRRLLRLRVLLLVAPEIRACASRARNFADGTIRRFRRRGEIRRDRDEEKSHAVAGTGGGGGGTTEASRVGERATKSGISSREDSVEERR